MFNKSNIVNSFDIRKFIFAYFFTKIKKLLWGFGIAGKIMKNNYAYILSNWQIVKYDFAYSIWLFHKKNPSLSQLGIPLIKTYERP